jgi:hypothetical protein
MKTSAGKITTRVYDDGDTKGVEILLNGIIVAALNVYKEGNACVSVATKDGIEHIIIKE